MKYFNQAEQYVLLLETTLNPAYPSKFERKKIKEALRLYIIYIIECIWILFFMHLLSLRYFCAWGLEPTPFPSQPQQEEMGLVWKKKKFVFRIFHTFNMGYTVLYIPGISMGLIGEGGGAVLKHMWSWSQ